MGTPRHIEVYSKNGVKEFPYKDGKIMYLVTSDKQYKFGFTLPKKRKDYTKAVTEAMRVFKKCLEDNKIPCL